MTTKLRRYRRLVAIAIATSASVVLFSIGQVMYSSAFSGSSEPTSNMGALVSNWQQVSPSVALGETCLPSGATESEFVGEIEGPYEIFQIWRLTVNGESVLRVNTLFGEACGLAYDSRYDRIFSDQVSMDIAEQLSLLLYQRSIDQAGGIAAFQAALAAELADDDGHYGGSYYAPEDVWALNQLGIRLPAGEYELLEPGNLATPQEQR